MTPLVSTVQAFVPFDPYLSLKALAQYTSLSERALERLLGEIPHYRIGRRVIVRLSDADAWIAKHRGQTVDDLLAKFRR